MSATNKGKAGAVPPAMILAAGFGKRMRPITDSIPKPLVQIRGQAMIDHVLDRCSDAGVTEAVVNLHHLPEKLRSHLSKRAAPNIRFSDEPEILDTGGGVAKALPHFGDSAFIVANGDVVWLDGQVPALSRLLDAWDEERMDALLLLQPTVSAVGYEGKGDFVMGTEGELRRRREYEIAPFVFAGVQILHPRLFESAPDGPFSLNLLYDMAIMEERLFGLRHDGLWYHVGTPEAIGEVEEYLAYELGSLDMAG